MLDGSHLQELQRLLWEVRGQYQNFGIALGLLPGDITAIMSGVQHDAGVCLNAILQEVLKRGVTQEQLATALESCTLGYGQLAKKVRVAVFSKPPVSTVSV